MREIQIIILAAGLGTRLGLPLPKPLTPLADGRSILRHQLDNLRQIFADAARIAVVVGFRYDLIMAGASWIGLGFGLHRTEPTSRVPSPA